MRSRIRIPLLVALAGLLVFLFGFRGNTEEIEARGRSAVAWTVSRWNMPGSDSAHGWLIVPVAAWLVWRRRRELRAVPKSAGAWGVAVVVASIALYWLGIRVQQTRLTLLALIGLAWGIPFSLYGRGVARLLAFPCAFLVFAIPMSFLDSLTVPLRLFASAVSTFIVNGLGIEVTRQGTMICAVDPKGFRLGVDDPCSGLRSLLAIAAVTSLYAYLAQRRRWKQVVLVLSAVPLALAGNIVRIVAVALAAQALGRDRSLAFAHDASGYIVFVVAVILMMGVNWLLEASDRWWGFAWLHKTKS